MQKLKWNTGPAAAPKEHQGTARGAAVKTGLALTAAEVTEDLLKSRSASLNLRFLRSFLLLEFLGQRETP